MTLGFLLDTNVVSELARPLPNPALVMAWQRWEPVCAIDAEIAAIAVRHDLSLVSRNVQDYVKFSELTVLDWYRD